ncbi:MAG: hypothetical protein LBC90_02060 [Candidatus Adiutrix sp.]|jgi:hypothetical protein|nr:hypothetical protein [Candidatus Adiutrix sp.]
MADFSPPKNLFTKNCSSCQSGLCAEIPADKFSRLIEAVKDKFGAWPVDEEAARFVAEWVAAGYPRGAPAGLSLAFMSRYMDFAQETLDDEGPPL